jgi:hypothetical protein
MRLGGTSSAYGGGLGAPGCIPEEPLSAVEDGERYVVADEEASAESVYP